MEMGGFFYREIFEYMFFWIYLWGYSKIIKNKSFSYENS
jgi:hypothetical protein